MFKNSSSFNHWFFQRIFACSFFVFLVFIFLTDNLICSSIAGFFLVVHFNYGLETLLVDYMHDIVAKIYSEAVLDILVVCLSKAIFLFYIYM